MWLRWVSGDFLGMTSRAYLSSNSESVCLLFCGNRLPASISPSIMTHHFLASLKLGNVAVCVLSPLRCTLARYIVIPAFVRYVSMLAISPMLPQFPQFEVGELRQQ